MVEAAKPKLVKAMLVCNVELAPDVTEHRFAEWAWSTTDKRLPRIAALGAMLPGGGAGGVFRITGLMLTLPEWARDSLFRLAIGSQCYLEGHSALSPIDWRGDLLLPACQLVYVGLTVRELDMKRDGTAACAVLAGKWWPNEDAYFGRS